MTKPDIFNILLKMLCLAVFAFPHNFAFAEIHGTITGTTNYVWRMYTKSNNEPAIQANLDYQHASGFYTGASVSSFNIGKSEEDESLTFPDSAKVEISPYAGWSYKFTDDWRTDLQYSRYFYDGKIFSANADYNEFYLFLHYKDLLTTQFSYIDDYYGTGKLAFFPELTGRYPITDYLEISGTFGYAYLKEAISADYQYWNVGLTGRYKFIALDLRYHDASEKYFLGNQGTKKGIDHPDTLASTVVFSLSAGF